MIARSAAILAAALLAGCGGVSPRHYAQEQPRLDLRQYFDGPLEAWGMVQNRSGEVIKRFHVQMQASWRDNIGTLKEDFSYADGSREQRIWTITRLDDHHYTGTAGDVVGSATGEAWGNALRWRYTLALPVDGNTYHVTFDDWMYLIDDQILLNRSVMTKFGYTLAEVTLSFRRATPINTGSTP